MMKVIRALVIVGALVCAVSCLPDQEISVYSVSYSFTDSVSGWSGGFADYDLDNMEYELQFEHATLPFNINADSSRFSLKLSGINHNKTGLFMFIKRHVTGLRPNTAYEVLFNVRVASNQPTGVTDDGGSPGDSVYVKVGATGWEPQAQLVNGLYEMNIDKGDHQQGGANMITVGNIGVNASTVAYTLITRNNNMSNGVVATTDDAGALWIIVGTDSNYAGQTTVYYTQVDALFNQLD